MTIQITRNGTRIVCTREEGAAQGVMLRVVKDAHRHDDAALTEESKPVALKLLEREKERKPDAPLHPYTRLMAVLPNTGISTASDRVAVGWVNWVEAKEPGGGAYALADILDAMRRRGVSIVGVAIVRHDGGDVQGLIDFYKARGFRIDKELSYERPVMVRELEP